jgi:hypothetical protein
MESDPCCVVLYAFLASTAVDENGKFLFLGSFAKNDGCDFKEDDAKPQQNQNIQPMG